MPRAAIGSAHHQPNHALSPRPALLWDDIDIDRQQIHVRRALWRGQITSPKSRRSQRAVDMPATLTRALQRLAERPHGPLVFGGEEGKPLDPDNLSHRRFPRALRQAGIARHVRLHDLRHTYASLLIAQGAHPKYIQVQMGLRRFRRRSTGTGISCRTCIERKPASSIGSCLARRVTGAGLRRRQTVAKR